MAISVVSLSPIKSRFGFEMHMSFLRSKHFTWSALIITFPISFFFLFDFRKVISYHRASEMRPKLVPGKKNLKRAKSHPIPAPCDNIVFNQAAL